MNVYWILKLYGVAQANVGLRWKRKANSFFFLQTITNLFFRKINDNLCLNVCFHRQKSLNSENVLPSSSQRCTAPAKLKSMYWKLLVANSPGTQATVSFHFILQFYIAPQSCSSEVFIFMARQFLPFLIPFNFFFTRFVSLNLILFDFCQNQ